MATLERWRTAITRVAPGEIAYRGTPIEEVMESWGFPATVWLLVTGAAPTDEQEDALRRVLVAACDHGLAAPSIAAARTCASTRGAPGVAMATGLLAFAGPAHGGAAGACAQVLIALRDSADVDAAVRERLAGGERIPGFGHPYHPRDPRVPGLLAAPLSDDGHRVLVRAVEAAIVAAKGPKLHMNADAAVAALMLDAGLHPSAIDLMTSIGRCVGLAAHVHEETTNETPFRAPSLESIEYTGPEGSSGPSAADEGAAPVGEGSSGEGGDMRLIEAASKDLLGRYGLKPPEGRLCTTPAEAEAAAAALGGTVYVKAQIPFGDRASLGLVGSAEDPEAVAAMAADHLGRAVDGMRVGSVLVESGVAPQLSAYVSVHVDDAAGARILRIGRGGGAGYHATDAAVQEPVPVGGLELFQVRNLVGRLGVMGADREAITRAAWAVLRAAREWHAYTVEVNPLFVTPQGPVAIDAKVELDDYSLATVPDPSLLPEKEESPPEREARLYNLHDHRGSLRYVQLVDPTDPGDADSGRLVGSHSVGGGESMVVFDALSEVGLVPTNYCDTSGAPSQEKVAFATKLIASQPHIRGYFFSSCIANQPLSVTAAGLIDGFEAAGWRGQTLVRIAGNQDEQAQEMIRAWAEEKGIDVTVVGREVDEWEAAALLAERLEVEDGVSRR